MDKGLLQRASVEPDKPVSRHPALRVDTQAVGKAAPLTEVVSPGRPGDIARLDDAGHVVRRRQHADLKPAILLR